jgi:hypothetical protein
VSLSARPQPPKLAVGHEFLDQRKELSLLKPDVCVEQLSRCIQRLSIDAAGRHGDLELASEPLELHVLDACLAEGSRLRRDVLEEKREELFFLIAKVDTLFVPEELPEVPGRRKPSRSISVRGSTAQPHCLHESSVMVVRERGQGGVALHSTTLGCSVVGAVSGVESAPVYTGPRWSPRRLGLDGQEPRTLAEVGRASNVSRERIRQIELQGLKKLRTLADAQRVRDVA